MDQLNAFSVSGVLITATTIVMVLLMSVWARSRMHVIWGFFCLSVMVWGFASYRIGIASTPAEAAYWWRFGYMGVIFIPVLFTHFIHKFLRIDSVVSRGFLVVCYLVSAAYLGLDLFSSSFIYDVRLMFGSVYFLEPTLSYNSFLTMFTGLIIYSHTILLLHYWRAKKEQRPQIGYFFLATSIGFTGGSLTFLPHYGISIYPYSNIFVALYPIIMGYAMFRHRLFNINLVAAHIFTLLVINFSVIRFVLSIGTNRAYLDGIFLVIVTGLGVLVVRSVIHEVEHREELRELSAHLQQSNTRLTELDHLKSQFLSFASHQLKSPLTSIKWQSQLIADGSLGTVPQEVKDAGKNIAESVDRLVGLVNEFLNLRKIEEGKLEYVFALVDIPTLVQRVVQDLAPLATHKGLVLTYNDQTAHHRVASADTTQLTQVIQNLVDNAIKYTEKGSVAVTVQNDTPESIMITISDTGHGLDLDLIPHLFEEFRRASGATKRIEGTGLGLYIAKQIIMAHKGTIQASSPGPGKGSTFTVRLPRTLNITETPSPSTPPSPTH